MKNTLQNCGNLICCLALFVVLNSCKNYYNETIDWMDSISVGTNLETVKKTQPDFVEINWNKPLKIGNESYYEIIEINGNYDILNMSNYLVFVNGKFQGRDSKK